MDKREGVKLQDADSTSESSLIETECAIQIINLNDETKEFELNEEGLESILNHEKAKDKPVVVVSIAGDFRKGKSFMLNFFLRYLKAAEQGKQDDWLSDKDEPLKGFSWRCGMKRDTSGILMWSEPFNLTLSNGKEIAVLLMDTQGCFDSEHTFKDTATVFALSTMLSSIQVYNLMHNLQEDNLQFLQVYTEYGKLALENTKRSPFQKLIFLIRDWSFPYDCPYGFSGGKKLLDERLEERAEQAPQLKTLRKNLKECFQEISCCLMPHPGTKVAINPNFKGRISEMEEDFVQHLEQFIPSLLDVKKIPIKEIAGLQVTGNELIQYFKVYFNTFKDNEIPEPKSIMEATSEANNHIAVQSAKNLYIKEMEEICGGKKPFISPSFLEKKHNEIKKRAMTCFFETKKFGGEEFSRSFIEKLETDLKDQFERYKETNQAKNVFAMLGAPMIFLIYAVVLIVLSKIVDIIGIAFLSSIIFTFATMNLVVIFIYFILKVQGTFPEFVQGIDDVAETARSFTIQVVMNLARNHLENNGYQRLQENHQIN